MSPTRQNITTCLFGLKPAMFSGKYLLYIIGCIFYFFLYLLLHTLVTVFSGDFMGCSGGGLDFLFDGVLLILGEWNLSFSFMVKDVKWERWDSEGR